MEDNQDYIVMFPFMAQGHIIPFLALSHKLTQTKNLTIIFINTPQNIKKLKSSQQLNNPSPKIHFLKIPFDSTDYGLPPNTENSDSLPYDLIISLIESTQSLKPIFRNLVKNLISEKNGVKPLCIVYDMFFSWVADVGFEFGVFNGLFVGGGGFGFACYYSLWLNLPSRLIESDSGNLLMDDFPEASEIHVTQLTDFLRNANGEESFSKFQQNNLNGWKNADGILFNTVEEIDELGLTYFRRKLGIPVFPVGPVLLPKNRAQTRTSEQNVIKPEVCKLWLDSKPVGSVLYISFGSQNTISASQLMQLAMALDSCGRSFIWVVRPPLGFDIKSEFKPDLWFPSGFEERMMESKRGLLIYTWAPQVEILCHESVSAFLSHCGWNSVLESLSRGVPIIGWPVAAEQFYNVKLLEEEVGVCVEVARGKSCEVKYGDIVEKIELVMGETEKGKEMRRKAMEVKEIIKNAIRDEDGFKGSSVKAMDEFLNGASEMKLSNKLVDPNKLVNPNDQIVDVVSFE